MGEHVGRKRRRAWGGLALFDDGIEWWFHIRKGISYKRATILLIAVVLTIALLAHGNAGTVLDWLKTLAALFG